MEDIAGAPRENDKGRCVCEGRLMKNKLPIIAYTVFLIAAISFGAWYTISVWHECRATNSIMYCLKLVSK